MKLQESNLPAMYSKALYDNVLLDLAPEYTNFMYDILICGTADLLNGVRSMDRPVSLILRKLDESFVAAAILQYFANDDSDNPGNWSFVWTFNEEDVPETALKLYINDAQTHPSFISIAGNKYGIRFCNNTNIINCMLFCVTQLKKWLNENAKENEETVIELDGIFQARVAVENGEKVFSLEPGSDAKIMIKNDAMIEK